jgi:hypothetical protein
MLMIASDHEKKPLGIFLITRVRVTSASRPVERGVVTPIPGLFSVAKHPGPIGGRMSVSRKNLTGCGV